MPALRQATGFLYIDCKLSQLTKQVGSCQRGVTFAVLDLGCCGGHQFSAAAAVVNDDYRLWISGGR